MQASETKLREIIQGDKQYIVPLFQRPYSWKKSQWEALWNDILELCNTENPRPHFMGSIVTIPVSGLPEGVSKYLLIDGQQRLTTIFILFSALRDQVKDTNKQLAEELHNKFLINQYQQDPEIYKLQPTQVDRESFYSLINSLDNSVHNIDKNAPIIKQCYSFFDRKIRQSNLEFGRIKQVISSYLS
ncbi:MAG: DUF262 domain-containing protein, partial [Dolichospermum sp.]